MSLSGIILNSHKWHFRILGALIGTVYYPNVSVNKVNFTVLVFRAH